MKNNSIPLLSIIVPIYRVEKYLSICIESIINNELDNIEVILVDDGSPDGCPKICDEYASKYENVVVIHKENGGLVSARKAGIAAAAGEYITFVDGDDYIDDYYYKKAFESQDKKPDIFIMAIKKELNNNKYVVWRSEFPSGLYENKKEIEAIARGVLFDDRMRFKTLHSVCSMIVKTSIYKKIINCVDNDVSIYEDTIFSLNCIANSTSVCIQNENIGYFYRNVSDSMTKDKKKDLFLARIVYSKNLSTLKKKYPEIITENDMLNDMFRCGIKQMMEYYSNETFFGRFIFSKKINELFVGDNPISIALRENMTKEVDMSVKKAKLLNYYKKKYVLVLKTGEKK